MSLSSLSRELRFFEQAAGLSRRSRCWVGAAGMVGKLDLETQPREGAASGHGPAKESAFPWAASQREGCGGCPKPRILTVPNRDLQSFRNRISMRTQEVIHSFSHQTRATHRYGWRPVHQVLSGAFSMCGLPKVPCHCADKETEAQRGKVT